jgi:hypothetical protein
MRSAIAFLLMLFAGWVHRLQLMIDYLLWRTAFCGNG